MNSTLIAKAIKQQVTLPELLRQLGYEPQKRSGPELRYLSMLRHTDTKPSFSVNEKEDVWYDHGLGTGGDLIDFALAFWPHLSFSEALQEIQSVMDVVVTHTGSAPVPDAPSPVVIQAAVPSYVIESVLPLGKRPALADYLKSRGIWQAAQGKLQAITYRITYENGCRRLYYAACWPNNAGGWEIRNPVFKGCLGHKALTCHAGNPSRLAVFEGYFDYLSWLTLHPDEADSALILNSLSLLEPALEMACAYPKVRLFLDRDEAGRNACQTCLSALPQAKDESILYAGYKDFNDYLMARPGTTGDESERVR